MVCLGWLYLLGLSVMIQNVLSEVMRLLPGERVGGQVLVILICQKILVL